LTKHLRRALHSLFGIHGKVPAKGEGGRVNGSGRRFLLLVLLASVVAALIVVPAAGSGAAEAGGVSAHEVAQGLRKIQSIAVDASAYSSKDKAKAAESAGSIEGVWKTIEDTVRGNDKDAYIAFEDAFDKLGAAARAGDATEAGKAAHDVSTAVGAYLAKHPDVPDAPSRAAAAASAPSPSGSAAPTASGSAATSPSGSAASASASVPSAAPAPAGALARTGPHDSALAAVAGAAFGLGGLALIAGARRRRLSPTA
jgi:hypothetical protein